MQRHWSDILRAVLDREPNVGRLVELCEENYRLLLQMLPDLRDMQGNYVSSAHGQADLRLQVLEHSRYTSLVHLTYDFVVEHGRRQEPDALLRVYHDTEQVEVIDLNEGAVTVEALYEVPGLLNKWRANLFVAKWLDFCMRQGHRFESAPACLSCHTESDKISSM